MKKTVLYCIVALLVIGSIVAIFVLRNKSKDKITDEKLKIGRYVYCKEGKNELASVEIKENNEFIFNRNIAMNYVPTGKYEIKDDTLILNSGVTETYEFKISGDKLIYLNTDSSFLEKGAEFIYDKKSRVSLACMYQLIKVTFFRGK